MTRLDDEDRKFFEEVIADKVKNHTISERAKLEIKYLRGSMGEFKKDFIDFKDEIKKEIKDGFASIKSEYATKADIQRIEDKYGPLKKTFDNGVKLILSTIIIAVLALVIKG